MPRRTVLSALERENLLALPRTEEELIRHYTLSEADLGIIDQRRGPANRFGFAGQLCSLRFPGIVLSPDQSPFPPLLHMAADQLKIAAVNWRGCRPAVSIKRNCRLYLDFSRLRPITIKRPCPR